MIEVECTIRNEHKVIYYRDRNDVAIRVLVLTLDNQIIQDEISEYSKEGKLLCRVVYAPDFKTIIGYREYRNDGVCGHSDYRNINGKMKKIASVTSFVLEENKKSRCDFYDSNDNLLCYELFEYKEPYGFTAQGFFDLNDCRIMKFAPLCYTDYR